MATINVRVVGRNLPGLRCGDRQSVHVGVQRGAEVVDIVPGDAATAVFAFTIDAVTGNEGSVDFRGPFVHGKRGERFLYLSWGEVEPDGHFAMFRRAKLHLSALDAGDIARAQATGTAIEAALDLTDAHGDARCGSLRPPYITWQTVA